MGRTAFLVVQGHLEDVKTSLESDLSRETPAMVSEAWQEMPCHGPEFREVNGSDLGLGL